MSEFHRMITYLYLYEHGTKRHNTGFAKIEKRGEQCLVEIHLKNTGHNTPSAPVYFYAKNGQKLPGILVGTIGLSRGNGDFKSILKGEALAGSNYSLEDVKGIFIPLSKEIMFVSQWDDNEFVRDNFVEPTKLSSDNVPSQAAPSAKTPHPQAARTGRNLSLQAASANGNPTSQAARTGRNLPLQAASANENSSLQATPVKASASLKNPQDAPVRLITAEPVPPSAADLEAAEAAPKPTQNNSEKTPLSQGAPPLQEALPENWEQKWKFILENYPVMTPFAGDENTLCVRLELKDIRLLPRPYWYLGNNSFLLHGFFNYRYLILGAVKKSDKKRWFIGIPGVYQNPERVMATLFGFPEFRNEKSVPVNTGEFGYWYRYLN